MRSKDDYRCRVRPSHAGLELIDADSENGRIDLALATREDFTNPTGNVLGPIEE